MEKCLEDGFVRCYLLDLLRTAGGREPEVAPAVLTLVHALEGWAHQLGPRVFNWAIDLSSVAYALLCLPVHVHALSQVQAATRGVAREVSQALKDKPWASQIAHAWLVGEAKVCHLMAKLPFDLEDWHTAAEMLPGLRNWMSPALLGALESMMWRVLAADFESFVSRAPDADAALDIGCAEQLLDRLRIGRGLACLDKPPANSLDAMEQKLNRRGQRGIGQRAFLYRVAGIVENMLDSPTRDTIALLRAIHNTCMAAKECEGMRLGADGLFSAFKKLGVLAEIAAFRGWYGEWANVALASVDCSLALADIMEPADPVAETLLAAGDALRRLPMLAATVQAKAASAEFGRLGPDFEARYVADHSRCLVRVFDALDVLDKCYSAGDSGELYPVDAARNILSDFWAFCEWKAVESIAAAQAELTRFF